MSICIGTDCYEKVAKDDRIYFIKIEHLLHNKLSTETETNVLIQYSDYVFNVIKSKYGTEELMLCPR